MRNRIIPFIIGSGIFLFFVFFSWLVHRNLFTHFDFDMTVRLQDHISRRLDGAFSAFSVIGSFEPMIILLIILLILRKKVLGILVFVSFGMMHVFELYGKFFVDHPPPPEFMLRTEKLVNFPQFYVRAESSYPSGHAARAAFITIVLGIWIYKSKKLSKNQKIIFISILVAYDLVMFVSRVYLGEHWLTDVIGGVLLGSGLAMISSFFLFLNPFGKKIAK